MKASDLLVRCLKTEGVEYIFGLPGEENADVMISLRVSPIKFGLCGANIVCPIWEDRWYGLIEWKQENEFKAHYDLSFTNSDFVKLAESFGGWGQRVTRSRDLRPVLEEAFNCGKPALVTMNVDYEENRKLSERLGQIVCPI